MLYLIIAILCSSCITLIFKGFDKYSTNKYAMLCCNYITCIMFGLFFMPKNQTMDMIVGEYEIIGLGVINGVLFLLCLLLNQRNATKNGAILTATFVRLGVLVPTLLSIFLFGERPSALQVIGIGGVVVAFVIMGKRSGGERPEFSVTAIKSLSKLMILGGITDSMSKVFEQMGRMELEQWFLLITFSVACILCIVIIVCKKQPFGARDCAMGIAIGVPNYLSTLFLLRALASVPAFIAYPVYSVGTILIVMLISFWGFKERLGKHQLISVGIIIGALILLNS